MMIRCRNGLTLCRVISLVALLAIIVPNQLLGQQQSSGQAQLDSINANIEADNRSITQLQDALDALEKSHPDMTSQTALTVDLFFSEVVKTLGGAFVSAMGDHAKSFGKEASEIEAIAKFYDLAQSLADMKEHPASNAASIGSSLAGAGGWEVRQKQLAALSDGVAAVEKAWGEAKDKPDMQNFAAAAGSLMKFIGEAAEVVKKSDLDWANRLGKAGQVTSVIGDLSKSVQTLNDRHAEDQKFTQAVSNVSDLLKQQIAGRIADVGRLQNQRSVIVIQEDHIQIPVKAVWTDELLTTTKQPNQDISLMTHMASDAHRVIIAGASSSAKQMYDVTTRQIGQQNTLWIQNYNGLTDLQSRAKEFGADIILGVRPRAPQVSTSPSLPRPPMPSNSADLKRPPQATTNPPLCPPGNPSCGGGGGAGVGRDGGDGGRGPLALARPPNPPPLPPSGGQLGLGGSGVGGVMLSGAARVIDAKHESSELGTGQFSLLFQDPSAGIDFKELRKFVTAMWAVYFAKDGPGISIDPIAPGAEQQFVRYIGKVLQSDLGRVMREADYMMKKWAVGVERPDIPNFKSVDRLTRENGLRYLGAARRFWFVPEDMQFRQVGNALLFDSGRMTVKTEYVLQNKGVPAEPADEVFAQTFTDRYSEIEARYPIYEELFNYAKLVSLARYIKDQNVPLLWFLMANKDLALTETAPPETVKALIKKSEVLQQVTIEGGVDLAKHAAQERYVMESAPPVVAPSSAPGSHSNDFLLGSKPSIVVSESNGSYVSHPSSELVVTGGTTGGSSYQTDLALRHLNEPGLELVRKYDPAARSSGFGPGWQMLQPYRVEPASDIKTPFANVRVPEKMRVENLITGQAEILTFNRTKYAIEAYVPDDAASTLLFMVWMSNGTVRLVDKLGNEFQFDGRGRTREMIISDDYKLEYLYDTETAGDSAFDKVPYELHQEGAARADLLGGRVSAPARFTLTDLRDGTKESFTVDRKPSQQLVGWAPDLGSKSKFQFMGLMNDGSFSVEDKDGNEIRFKGDGKFDNVTVPVLRGLRQGDERIEFNYEYRAGQFRIREARVMREGLSASLYSIRYDYGPDERLASVTGPDGKVSEIHYAGASVSLSAKN